MSESVKENDSNHVQSGPSPSSPPVKPRPVTGRKSGLTSAGLRTQTPSNRSRLTGPAQRIPVPASEGPVSRTPGLPASMDIRGLSREDLLRRWKEEKEMQTPKKLGAMTPKDRIQQWRKETGGETPRQAYRPPVVARTPRFEAEAAGQDVDVAALRAKMEEIVRTKEEEEEARLGLVQLGSSAETPGVQQCVEYWLFRAKFEEQARRYEEVVRLYERAAQLSPGQVEPALRAFLARMQAASRQQHALRFTPRDGAAYLLLVAAQPRPTPQPFPRCEVAQMAQYWAARLAALLTPLLPSLPLPTLASPLPSSPRKVLTPSKLTGRPGRILRAPEPDQTQAQASPTKPTQASPVKASPGKAEAKASPAKGKAKARAQKPAKTPLRRLRASHVAVLATPGQLDYDQHFPALPPSPDAPKPSQQAASPTPAVAPTPTLPVPAVTPIKKGKGRAKPETPACETPKRSTRLAGKTPVKYTK